MKNLSLLVWFSQLGLSVVLPLAGFILLAVWLNRSQGWGTWVIWIGVALGIISAVSGFRSSLKSMEQLAAGEKEDDVPVSFNNHD